MDISAGTYALRARGSVLKFSGFLALYEEGKDEVAPKKDSDADEVTGQLPVLEEGETLTLRAITKAIYPGTDHRDAERG